MTRKGYKNPPPEHQFKKGQSGNPNGRPRKSKATPLLDLAELLAIELSQPLTVQENGQAVTITKAKAFVKQMVTQAINGKPSQQRIILALQSVQRGDADEDLTLEEQTRQDEDLIAEILGMARAIDPSEGGALG
jgi:hypothetical protein